MSTGAEAARRPDLSRRWERLEQAAEEALLAVGYWKRRTAETEDEVARLRRTLESLSAHGDGADDGTDDGGGELRRLRAENAALRSRMQEARKRVQLLAKRLSSLGLEP